MTHSQNSQNFQESPSGSEPATQNAGAQNDENNASTPEGFTGPAAYRAHQSQAAQDTQRESDELGSSANQSGGMESGQNPQNPEKIGNATTDQVAQLEQALAQARDQLLRTVAELDNMRKRSQREREDATKYAISGFARDLLDVADTFKRALHAIPEDVKLDERNKAVVDGLEAMERALLRCFEKNGVKRIEPIDELFDPHYHEVMFEAPFPDKAQGTIIQLIEPGYLLHDRLLRPARVGVAKSVNADQAQNNESHSLDTQA